MPAGTNAINPPATLPTKVAIRLDPCLLIQGDGLGFYFVGEKG